jgi:uncharacterized membrane protein
LEVKKVSEQLEVTNDDLIIAALGYPIPFIAIFILLLEEKKNRPFLKFHAIQAIVLNVLLWILIVVFGTCTLGFGLLCAPFLWLVTLWPAYDSYKGNYTEIPVITNFIKSQGWI